MRKSLLLSILVTILLIMVIVSCTKKPDPVKIENQPPNTYLVNVPSVSSDTLDTTYIYHARIIYWYGTDSDGIVVRYDWAIDSTVYNPNVAGSGWHSLYMDSTLATQDTIAFEAPLPDTTYTHTFFVRAVDNDGAPDPTPAKRIFNTDNIPPNTRFVSAPTDSTQRFILQDSTSRWKGINFEWTAIDSDMVFPAQFQYIWKDPADAIPSMDDPDWSEPVETESYYFTGQNAPYEEGWHRVYIRAVDDAGAVDQCLSDTTIVIIEEDTLGNIIEADTIVYNQWKTLYFVKPEIYTNPDHRKLLWINFATSGSSTFAKPFYHAVLEDSLNLSFDSLDYNSAVSDSINHKMLGNYSTIIWSKEDGTSWPDYPLDLKEDLLSDFLHVGGRIIFSGSKVLNMSKACAPDLSFALDNLFPYRELHIVSYILLPAGTSEDTIISPLPSDTAFYSEDPVMPYLFMENNTSYPNTTWWNLVRQWFQLEALKLDLWGTYNGELETIYSINHYRDNALFEKEASAIRFTYTGEEMPSFFYFGFPLSYFNYGQSTALLRQVLKVELQE